VIEKPDGPGSEGQKTTGSHEKSEPVFLQVGVLRKTHGIRGDLVMDILTDFPERLVKGKRVFIGNDYKPAHLARVRSINDKLLVSIVGYPTPEAAAALRNASVFVKAETLPELEEGSYYHHQLLGLRVVNESGAVLGTLAEILETGANEVYVVLDEAGKETLIPAVPEFVISVDLNDKLIRVREPDWR